MKAKAKVKAKAEAKANIKATPPPVPKPRASSKLLRPSPINTASKAKPRASANRAVCGRSQPALPPSEGGEPAPPTSAEVQDGSQGEGEVPYRDCDSDSDDDRWDHVDHEADDEVEDEEPEPEPECKHTFLGAGADESDGPRAPAVHVSVPTLDMCTGGCKRTPSHIQL